MKAEKAERGVRITQQFRSGHAMVYDLRDDSGRLTLRILARQSDAEPGDFCVEATSSDAREVPAVTGWGSTRADALRAAGASWAEARDAIALPTFDWEAVARALRAVRAV